MYDMLAAFTVRQSGNIGQEILGPDGQIVAWTTNDWAAQVICRLLNDNEELLKRGGRTDDKLHSTVKQTS